MIESAGTISVGILLGMDAVEGTFRDVVRLGSDDVGGAEVGTVEEELATMSHVAAGVYASLNEVVEVDGSLEVVVTGILLDDALP